jgi:hypothetical protein
MKLLVEAPLNSLSLGNVTINILKELKNKNVEVGLFPVGNVDIQAYNLSKDFTDFLQFDHSTFHFLHRDL